MNYILQRSTRRVTNRSQTEDELTDDLTLVKQYLINMTYENRKTLIKFIEASAKSSYNSSMSNVYQLPIPPPRKKKL